jgi:hypothetical protein
MRSSARPGAGPGLVCKTCHELRHTCLTWLREHGMSLEAAGQAGHRSITSTQLYLPSWCRLVGGRVPAGRGGDRGPGVGGRSPMIATAAPMIVDNERPPIGEWEQIAGRVPRLAATVDAYLNEFATTRSPATVAGGGRDVAAVRRLRQRRRSVPHDGRRDHRA